MNTVLAMEILEINDNSEGRRKLEYNIRLFWKYCGQFGLDASGSGRDK
jgi:hypothetical protein